MEEPIFRAKWAMCQTQYDILQKAFQVGDETTVRKCLTFIWAYFLLGQDEVKIYKDYEEA